MIAERTRPLQNLRVCPVAANGADCAYTEAAFWSGCEIDTQRSLLSSLRSAGVSASRSPESAACTAFSARLSRLAPLRVNRAGRDLPDEIASGRAINPMSSSERRTRFIA